MKKGKQVLSLALALLMVLTLVSVAALAADSDFTIKNGVLIEYKGSGGNVVIPDGVVSIGGGAFAHCYDLTNVTIPDSVTSIGESTFWNCVSLTDVTIPNSVTSIGATAFWDCVSLTNVTIPDSVTCIGSGAFRNTPWLNSLGEFAVVNGILINYQGAGGAVAIPDGVTSIGEYAFHDCDSLTSVTIPNSLTSIGDAAFGSCDNLARVTIPDSVSSIGDAAFVWCYDLTRVTIPNSVTSIGGNAFHGTQWLESLGEFAVVNGILLQYQGTDKVVTIPGNVVSIGNGAFRNCYNLTKVTIPDSVINIGDGAFYDCSSLTNVTVPDSVTSIGGEAFYNTPWLKSLGEFAVVNGILLQYRGIEKVVTIPNNVTSIGERAFPYCYGLTSVTIPNSVTNIEKDAFYNRYSLTDVYYDGTETQWAAIAIEIADYTDPLAFATIHYNNSAVPTTDVANTAYASTQEVDVDGRAVTFACYALKDESGNMTNYIKLRDLAALLNGSAAQFQVGWDGLVTITTKTAYTPNGSELSTPYSGDREYKEINVATKVDGQAVDLAVFMLTDDQGGGYTYYQLRDLAQALNFNVGWSADKGIYIETNKPYDIRN